MKKIALILAATAALATSAYASQRNNDLRDTGYYTTSGVEAVSQGSANADSAAFAVANAGNANSAFERMTQISNENGHGRH